MQSGDIGVDRRLFAITGLALVSSLAHPLLVSNQNRKRAARALTRLSESRRLTRDLISNLSGKDVSRLRERKKTQANSIQGLRVIDSKGLVIRSIGFNDPSFQENSLNDYASAINVLYRFRMTGQIGAFLLDKMAMDDSRCLASINIRDLVLDALPNMFANAGYAELRSKRENLADLIDSTMRLAQSPSMKYAGVDNDGYARIKLDSNLRAEDLGNFEADSKAYWKSASQAMMVSMTTNIMAAIGSSMTPRLDGNFFKPSNS